MMMRVTMQSHKSRRTLIQIAVYLAVCAAIFAFPLVLDDGFLLNRYARFRHARHQPIASTLLAGAARRQRKPSFA